jgi:hypothetical protein
VVCLIALYYLLPVNRGFGISGLAVLAAGIVILSGVIALEVRSVVRSDYPTLRALQAMAFTVTVYLLGFAMVCFVMERTLAESFTQSLSRTDALYFAVTVFSSVGFGDIFAKTETGRLVVTVQMLGNLVLIGLGLRVLLSAARVGRERRLDQAQD